MNQHDMTCRGLLAGTAGSAALGAAPTVAQTTTSKVASP
jgi:hypothetical protein